jgi:branched-chain amino acid transport system ATP-binding protein
VVEQNALSVLQVCDRIYVMDTGRIVHHGPARDLLENDAERIRLLGI